MKTGAGLPHAKEPQKLGERPGHVLPWSPQREHGPVTPCSQTSSLQNCENKFLLFKPPHLSYFVMAAQARLKNCDLALHTRKMRLGETQ